MVDRDPVREYLQVVATVREFVEEQIQLGFAELKEPEPAQREEQSPFPDFDMSRLQSEAMACTRCELHPTRNTVVFGVGDENADLMFVGEAPGADEDRQGEPFVGRAGQLLTKIIEAMGFTRDGVYIANVIKCRPPGNRNPKPIEIETCEPFLLNRSNLYNPKSFALSAALPHKLCCTPTKKSQDCGGDSMTTTAPNSCPPIIPPFCYATHTQKERSGKI